MSSSDLKISIERLGASFTGASRTDSTTRWVLDLSKGSTIAYGDLTSAQHNLRVFVSREPLETSPNMRNTQVILARGICHLIVDRLPDAALPELMESLKTMFEFYNLSREQAVALPAPRRAVSGKVTGRQERRPLSFDTE